MDDAQKKALIKKLSAAKNFDARYSEANRKWFVGKIIDALLSRSVADADVERLTNDIIKKANAELKDRITKGFASASLKTKWTGYKAMTSRTQIIYGMIAMHPEFLLGANKNYFDFILERRFRSIQRMAFYVNSDAGDMFAYPSRRATPPEKMKVNAAADSFWRGVVDNTLPFVLTPAGKSNPNDADEKLFSPTAGSGRNLFACDPVATILHMDALREAKKPDDLMKALVSAGDHYLKIDNPLGHFANDQDGQRLVVVSSAKADKGNHVDIAVGKIGPILEFIQQKLTPEILRDDTYIPFPGTLFLIIRENTFEDSVVIESVNAVTKIIRITTLKNSYAAGAKIYATKANFQLYKTLPYHFVTDSRPDHALFEQRTLKSVDLQVGDHVYVINHPLYKIYRPSGAWGGEHSFISQIDSRDSAAPIFRNAVMVEGHGWPPKKSRTTGTKGSLLEMGNFMVGLTNEVVRILQALTRIHLGFLKDVGRPTAETSVDILVGKTNYELDFFKRNELGTEVNVFEYHMSYTYIDYEKNSIEMKKGFVIKEQSKDPDSAFQIFNYEGTDSLVDATHPPPVGIRAIVFTGSGPTERFTLSKWAALYFNAQTATLETLPLFKKDNKTPTLLDFNDLAKSNPFFLTDDDGIAFVTRPRVDFSSTYQKFLQDNGAI